MAAAALHPRMVLPGLQLPQHRGCAQTAGSIRREHRALSPAVSRAARSPHRPPTIHSLPQRTAALPSTAQRRFHFSSFAFWFLSQQAAFISCFREFSRNHKD